MSRIASTLSEHEAQFKKPKVSIRDNFIRNHRKVGERIRFDRNGKLKRRKPLKKLSRARRNDMKKYVALSTKFLLRPENFLCEICRVRRERGENILQNPSSEIHHWGSRNGRLLCYVPWFRPSCFRCRSFPHDNPNRAREWGLLAPANIYGVVPGNGSD